MALLWIDAAKSNLQTATNSYAEIQRQLDRYNKIFETYATANPETQMRAASVMRQALDEYNGLKKQQEENALKIYEAQQRVDYYKKDKTQTAQPTQNVKAQTSVTTQPLEEPSVVPTEQVPVITTATPWTLNNNAPATNVEVNAIDTNKTMNVPTPIGTPKNTINPTAPIRNVPKYTNTTIGPVNNKSSTNINWSNYWPGSIIPNPGTWWIAWMNSLPTITYRNNSNNWINTLKRWWNKYIVQPILRRLVK